MSATAIRGVVPIIPLPFREDESIDQDGLAALCDFAARQRVGALCLPAYGSEFYKLSDEERLQAVRVAMETVGGRVPVMGQSNHGSARRAAELARANEKAGVSVVSVACAPGTGHGGHDRGKRARAHEARSVPDQRRPGRPRGRAGTP